MQKLIRKINSFFYYLLVYPLYKLTFLSFGAGSRIVNPLRIDGMKNIRVGKNVYIQDKTWLASVPLTGKKKSILEIGDGSIIGHFNHIYATGSIKIGKRVLTADKVYISDNLHSYANIFIPVMDQPINQLQEVVIGDGTWIGENVCIIGVTIGKNCVVGANAVVTKNIPDYSVVTGIPGKIQKRFNIEKGFWEKTRPNGEFICTE